MRLIFNKLTYKIVLAVILIALGFFVYSNTNQSRKDKSITTLVERGSVTETIAVSGFVEAKNTAELAFPSTGVITEVYAEEGMQVEAGEVLATLASSKLAADRSEAVAALRIAEAQLSETLAGPTENEKEITLTTVNNAANSLTQAEIEQAEKVENARLLLWSNDLAAVSNDPQETATAPTISGTYTCEQEGLYQIDVYSSGANSGYSYQLTGLEKNTKPVYVDQPSSLGTCGLYIQFDADSIYSGSSWTIEIPNTRSSTYVTYKNAYELALKQQETVLQTAADKLQLAEKQATEANAPARSEVVSQKRSTVAQAAARVAQIDALIADRSIVAPFAGVVTDVEITSGETANNTPVITVLAEDAFELKARIPEIDVRKIQIGQKTNVVFDAAQDELVDGQIKYISPLATEIDGVAYFEATIILETTPSWLRAGLNADIDIIIGNSENVLRLPKRFVISEGEKTYVITNETKREIKVIFTGNDGYLAVTGLKEGEEITEPK